MIYDKIDGHANRRVVFITLDKDGEVFSSTVSENPIMTDKTGFTFIVDDYVAEQISKFKVINGGLELIEGEELIEPEKTAEEIEREQLLTRLAELDGA
ncbi:hypothetical protein [Salinicoccus roseus]|uniref:hypothetical protein n=1 Tax=Salinicoccus roseus TaxID=45670 RepID=UPI0023019E21|nr:hypothetical protein [Salinicoccus roseus]